MTESKADEALQDPRWLRPQQRITPEAKVRVNSSTLFNHCPAQHCDTFRSNAELSSMSMVFDADWVRVGALIGEGSFSRVFKGLYTNPDSGHQSVVAVKILKRNMAKRR